MIRGIFTLVFSVCSILFVSAQELVNKRVDIATENSTSLPDDLGLDSRNTFETIHVIEFKDCLLYTSPSPRDS